MDQYGFVWNLDTLKPYNPMVYDLSYFSTLFNGQLGVPPIFGQTHTMLLFIDNIYIYILFLYIQVYLHYVGWIMSNILILVLNNIN